MSNNNSYEWDADSQTLTAKAAYAIRAFCEDYHVDRSEYNYKTIIAPEVKNCDSMFFDCKSFNQPVIIPDSVTDCSCMFADCKSFNQPVTIPDSVTDCRSMFRGCKSFNQPVTIPDSVTDCAHMFSGCKSFNQHVTIPDGVTDCAYMFSNCESFNQPVTIPDNVEFCYAMFNGCESFNQPVTIPENVESCRFMFRYCDSFDQSVAIPQNCKDATGMFVNSPFVNENGERKSYDELSDDTKTRIIKSLAEKTAHGDAVLTNREEHIQSLCERQKNMLNTLDIRATRAYEAANPNAFKEFRTFHQALNEAKNGSNVRFTQSQLINDGFDKQTDTQYE